jgi:uncharacterized membrane protein SirB2
MSYEVYKIMHLVSLVFLVACVGINFFSQTPPRWARIGGMAASFVLLVAGMGLLARMKLGWPSWVIGKMVIWLLVAVSVPIMAKRLKDKKILGFFGVIALLIVAVSLAVLKP